MYARQGGTGCTCQLMQRRIYGEKSTNSAKHSFVSFIIQPHTFNLIFRGSDFVLG